MILPWFVAWWICGFPALHEWNAWLVTLILAIVAL